MGGKEMSVETSSKILKIFGILDIIGGVLAVIMGIIAVFGGTLVTAAGEDEVMGLTATFVGIILIVTGIVDLIVGIFSIRAAKDHSKIGIAWVFAIIGLISSIASVGSALSNGGSITGSIPSLLFSILIFLAANTIKKANKAGTANPTTEA